MSNLNSPFVTQLSSLLIHCIWKTISFLFFAYLGPLSLAQSSSLSSQVSSDQTSSYQFPLNRLPAIFLLWLLHIFCGVQCRNPGAGFRLRLSAASRVGGWFHTFCIWHSHSNIPIWHSFFFSQQYEMVGIWLVAHGNSQILCVAFYLVWTISYSNQHVEDYPCPCWVIACLSHACLFLLLSKFILIPSLPFQNALTKVHQQCFAIMCFFMFSIITFWVV